MNDGKNEQQNDVFLEPISPFKINQKQQPNRAGLLDIITAESKRRKSSMNLKNSVVSNSTIVQRRGTMARKSQDNILSHL